MSDEALPDIGEPDAGNGSSNQDGRSDGPGYTSADRERILARLEDGESLSAICRDADMPSARSVYNWIDDDGDYASQITRARETGYQVRADRAILAAKSAEDAAKGRLAFDAERWYLGKLSNAFSDNKPQKTELTGKLVHGIEIEFVNKAKG